MKGFNIVAGFFKNGSNKILPWTRICKDQSNFKSLTRMTDSPQTVNSVIMDHQTFKDMNYTCLKDRLNIVIGKKFNFIHSNTFESPVFVDTLSDGLNIDNVYDRSVDRKFVIGNEELYNHAITMNQCKDIYLTHTDAQNIVCNQSTPHIPVPKSFKSVDHVLGNDFYQYTNISDIDSQEYKYLECMRDILENGEKIVDRTLVGTRSLFSKNLTFDVIVKNPSEQDLKKIIYQIPGLTTKKMFFKGVVWELIWFLNGNTDVKFLQDRNVKIWNGHSTREYLDSIGLHDVPTNNIGKGYGYQWINWNGYGINQIKKIIHQLKTDPTSRRTVLSAWNVGQLNQMALQPCHCMYLFKVTDHHKEIKTLNCQVILRSNDMFLGSPFNIASTAILTILISRCVGMIPGKISLNITDAHIYENHVDQVKEQLTRVPLEFPTMVIDKDASTYEDLCSLTYNDFKIDYYSWDTIKADMAI